MDEIEIIKERIRGLEGDYLNLMQYSMKRIWQLEKTINWLSLATSLSFLLAFLLIAHVAKWI